MFQEMDIFQYNQDQKLLFKSKSLIDDWYQKYPQLFDEDDLRIAKSQPQYHFFEWQAAIYMYETHGLLSLVEQYQFKNHKKKQILLDKILSHAPRLVNFIRDHKKYGKRQCPDLLVYAPDFSNWFFYEVKSDSDELKPKQIEFFEALSEICGKPIRIIRFKNLRS